MSALPFLLFASWLADVPCRETIQSQLESWNATSEVLKAPAGPLGGSVYRIATSELGVWITFHRPAGSSTTSLFLTDARGSRQLDVDDGTCEPVARSIPAPAEPPGDALTDEHVKALLSRDPRLVAYLWSPHLPLSVDGYAEIASATKALGIPLVAAVDASSDPDYARRTAIERGIPLEATRPLRSVELLFRDLAVHTPSAIFFFPGGVSPPLPGYRNRDAYRLRLEEVFEKVKTK